ncbi:MAG: 3-keto-5-aminohexanoate cleavage protein [Acidobacteriota bacterium]
MIQACLNGGRTRLESARVPLTPTELANEARAAVAAGATCLHIHPRCADGVETLAAERVAEALTAVRDAVPGTPVGVGTGAWIAPGGRARHEEIAAWQVLPDYVSLNVREDDAAEMGLLLSELGILIEAGLWESADVPRFRERLDPSLCCRILVEIGDLDAGAALAEAGSTLDELARLGHGLPVLLHGRERSAWPMVEEALRRGLDTRVGLEDMLVLPDGSSTPGNAALVRAAMSLS